jgi:hypothetical protein
MKQLIYSLLFVSSASFGQYIPGFHGDLGYAYEDFGNAGGYEDIVWIPQASKTVKVDSLDLKNNHCVHKLGTFSYSIQRNATKKTGTVTVSQPYSTYEYFALNFGKDENGKQKVLNLEKGNAYLKFTLKNTSNVPIDVHIGLKDSSNKIANASGSYNFITAYEDLIIFNIGPGDSYSDTVNFNDFPNEAQFKDSSASCGPFTYSGFDSTFNLSIVAGAYFVITNANEVMNDYYKSYKLENATIELSNIVIGGKSIVADIPYVSTVNSSDFFLYPNPARDVIHFSRTLDNVSLTDLSGNVALQTTQASHLDLGHLPKGVFLLRATSLTKPAKVIVE